MKRILHAGAAMLIVGCAAGEDESQRATVDRDTLTRRQKDSIVSTMPLPGAKGVGAAQRATDQIKANQDRLDSLSRRRN